MEAESTQTTETYLKVMAWLHANQKKLLIAAGVALAIGVAFTINGIQKDATEEKANAALLDLPMPNPRAARAPVTAAPFLDLAKEYPQTSAGEYAALLGSETLFLDGKYPEAHEEFSKFITQYPESVLLSQARVGVAASLEGEGKIADATQKYQELLLAYSSDANITSPVKLTLARLEEKQSKFEPAMNHYLELAHINNPYDPWVAEARERAQALLMSHPELRKLLPSSKPSGTPAAPGGLNLSLPPGAAKTTAAPPAAKPKP
jgi:predicted negative regulator of RcsB-dependent stress response